MTGTWSATINCWDGYRHLKDIVASVDDTDLPMMWLYGEKHPSDDEIEPTCSVKELLEQTQGGKDDKMGAVL